MQSILCFSTPICHAFSFASVLVASSFKAWRYAFSITFFRIEQVPPFDAAPTHGGNRGCNLAENGIPKLRYILGRRGQRIRAAAYPCVQIAISEGKSIH